MTIALLSVVGVWADDWYGSEEVVSEATTWIFNDWETADNVHTENNAWRVENKLYARSIASKNYSIKTVESTALTFSDGTSVSVTKYAQTNTASSTSYSTATSAGQANDDVTPLFAFNASVPGTVYVYMQEAGESHNSSFRGRIYFADPTDADSKVFKSKVNSSAFTSLDDIIELSYFSDRAGAYAIGSTTNCCKIYAIRFVPHVVINTATTWLFNNLKTGTFTATTNVGNGLYLRGKSNNVTIADETTYTSHTFEGESASTISKSVTLGYLNNLNNAGVNAYDEENFRGSVAFEAGVAGRVIAVMSNSDGNARIYSSTSTTALLTESTTSAPKEHSANVPKGSVFIGSRANNTKLYALRFVPEEVSAPIIRNNNGTVTITAGTSSIGTTVKTYYTTNGEEPAVDENLLYTVPFQATTACTIKAITVSDLTTSSTVSEKSVPTIPTALAANTLSFAGLTLENVTLDDEANYTTDTSVSYPTITTNSANASSITANNVSFCYERNSTEFTLHTSYLQGSAAISKITIPGLTSGQTMIAKVASSSSSSAAFSCTSGGTLVSGSATTKTSDIAAATNLIVTSTGGNMELSTAAGFRLFNISIANTLTASVAAGQTSMGSAVVTTEPLITETNYFTTGSSVTVTATPNDGYRFVNWKNGDADVSTDAACTFGLNEDVELTANFAKSDLALSDGSGENGTITFKKGEDVVTTAQVGDEVTIVVTPATGYQLQDGTLAANYNDGEAKTADISESKFTMPAYAVSVGATFETISYTISYDLAEGTVESANPTSYTVETESFTLNNPTKVGCTFAGWKLNGEGDPQTTVTITQGSTGNRSYTATWSTDVYTLTLPEASNGNSITATKTTDLNYNESVTLTITPAANYTLKSISATGVTLSGTGNTRTFTMPAANVNVSATWVETSTIDPKTEIEEEANVGDTSAEITNVTIGENTTEVSISGTIGGQPVTSIAEDAFSGVNFANVTSVDLSNTQVALTMARTDGSSPVKNVPANTLIYLPSTSSMTGENVIIHDGSGTEATDFTCSNFVMTDAKAYSVPQAFTATAATLNRTFVASQTCTVCLPYTVAAGNIPGRIYRFTSITSNQVTMTEDTDGLDANVPYIFVPNGTDNISQTGGGITVQIASAATAQSDFTFKGIYEHHAFTSEEITKGVYGFAGNAAVGATPGHFAKATTGAYIEGMRAYLEYSGGSTDPGIDGADVPASARGLADGDALPDVLNVVLVNADGSTTNIGRLELIDTDDNTPRYNLSGQRVDKSYKGIVIINGRKVVIK